MLAQSVARCMETLSGIKVAPLGFKDPLCPPEPNDVLPQVGPREMFAVKPAQNPTKAAIVRRSHQDQVSQGLPFPPLAWATMSV